jgi:hypothetical protein
VDIGELIFSFGDPICQSCQHQGRLDDGKHCQQCGAAYREPFKRKVAGVFLITLIFGEAAREGVVGLWKKYQDKRRGKNLGRNIRRILKDGRGK